MEFRELLNSLNSFFYFYGKDVSIGTKLFKQVFQFHGNRKNCISKEAHAV